MYTSKNGGALQALILFGPILISLAVFFGTMVLGSYPLFPWQTVYVSMGLLCLGAITLVMAKIRHIKKLQVTFGVSELNASERRLYYAAYSMLALATLLMIVTSR